MPIINVLEYLDSIAARLPDKPAFCDDALQLCFGEVDRRSRAVGTALAAHGYNGEPVVVFMEKGPAAVSAFFGAVRAGCFYDPLDEEMPRHRIELIFGMLRPRAVIYDATTKAALEGLDYLITQDKKFSPDELNEILNVEKSYWRDDAKGIREFYAKIGDRLPAEMIYELDKLERNVQ